MALLPSRVSPEKLHCMGSAMEYNIKQKFPTKKLIRERERGRKREREKEREREKSRNEVLCTNLKNT